MEYKHVPPYVRSFRDLVVYQKARALAREIFYEEIGRMLGGMIAKSTQFWGDSSSFLREAAAEYFANHHPSAPDYPVDTVY